MTDQFSSYSLAVLCSLALHGLLVTLLVVGWAPAREQHQVVKPRYIEAKLLQFEPRAKAAPKVDADAARRRAEQEKKAAQEREAQRRREQAQKEKAQQEAERKRKEEAARKEKARQEQLKKEQAEKKRLEEQKRLEAQKREQERRKAMEQDLASALAKEEDFIEAASDDQLTAGYVDYISARIESNWSRPPSARRGMEVILEIQLVPTGRVAGVAIVKSSGNSAFDRAAEQAVYKVGQFDQLKGMDPGLFERNFRRLRLVFKPEDLRL